MQIDATAVIEAQAEEIKSLTQRAILAETQVRALLAAQPEPEPAE